MTRLLALLVLLAIAGAAQAQIRTPASPVAPQKGNAEPVPTSALDGNWRGTSDGGSCNAPLDYVLTIENGFVDGSAYDNTAQGPKPNTHHGPPPANRSRAFVGPPSDSKSFCSTVSMKLQPSNDGM